jgi:hypothetical protein
MCPGGSYFFAFFFVFWDVFIFFNVLEDGGNDGAGPGSGLGSVGVGVGLVLHILATTSQEDSSEPKTLAVKGSTTLPFQIQLLTLPT